MDHNLVFVYGTLKKGFGNNRLLKDSEFVGTFRTPPDFHMVSLGGFPGVIDKGSTPISGEVYKVTKPVMDRLDSLEGYPSFYTRKQIPTEFGAAWVYMLDESYLTRPRVSSGIWGE